MKPEHPLVAERPLARHSAALVRPGPGPADLLPALARASDRMARALRGALAPLLGGEPPMVECAAPEEMSARDFAGMVPGLAAYSLYGIAGSSARLLSSIDAEAVLRLVDRAFGGPGEAPYPLPRELPLSAELMVQQIEAVIAARLAEAAGLMQADAITALRRDSNVEQLQPFAPEARLAMLTLSITEAGGQPWLLRIALPFAVLADLFGQNDRTSARPAPRGPADPLHAPYGDLPLPLKAVLVDMALPLSIISTLEVGQILSVPIARSVPLRVAGRTIAHGSIGAVDDRVAVQLTQLS
ncbi:FliM/FliN family flagellar motor switch protein [Novosphingobium sp. KCTC 2891]|uniref:FliM/FliN family flagellar motor switch protein n=1 Tax=Novosphingobium sp. KCTC 2891 TaxID=2989730 RepID=UPI00222264AB|nr:FliM/FliN family flagellar motor switch protein [Novosphingobium sp. KCTC 2891]MCW1383014.1 FliM/FliN family flagellar motor switch protein [Novosphingobium sp. KCTC 2891]